MYYYLMSFSKVFDYVKKPFKFFLFENGISFL